MNTPYIPQPIDTGEIQLTPDLLELTEVLAKNTHEVWAQQRFAQGWKYGAKRNDERKEHPCLVPYDELPESEKTYDRNTAMETLKVINRMGFNILKYTNFRKKLVLYRCTYELVNNTLRHAEASRIEVHLNVDEDMAYLSVVDNGCGFDLPTVQRGMGIKNLRTRLAAFGGNIAFYSEPGKGTEANVELKI